MILLLIKKKVNLLRKKSKKIWSTTIKWFWTILLKMIKNRLGILIICICLFSRMIIKSRVFITCLSLYRVISSWLCSNLRLGREKLKRFWPLYWVLLKIRKIRANIRCFISLERSLRWIKSLMRLKKVLIK